ncbi:hypothetical protein ZIOFF_009271 [Zingiber officinale]|uniref:Uncharacterized protein n=1 Tax=Zingiber officinale TaxID=94328 RepID=A0A8J5LW06_ZINOF|nr:hypothetical protein ZIOFF_009271 [Zingiber officinale]
MSHRRYLPLNHKWRKDKNSFDGTVEMRLPPKSFSGKDILSQVQDLEGIILNYSLSNIQLVEKCFGPQRHDHVFGHGGGVRPKDVTGPIASKQELHHENVTLREKMNNMESEFKAFKELMLKNLPPNVQVTASTSNTIEG